jgi:hypothetical protein
MASYRSLSIVGPIIAVSVLFASNAVAQQRFQTPEDAAQALVSALKSGSTRDIRRILGRDSGDVVESGDDVDDAEIRQKFTNAYDQKHSIKVEGNKTATLIVGADDFPFPIPLDNGSDGWKFDTASGRREILYRRIGRNELAAIQTSLAYVDAQNEYADKDRTGAGRGVYAQRVVSSPGKKDGLYWRDDQDPSPLGELAAKASAEGYKVGEDQAPYHGYYYRILKSQGPNAPGGALNYLVRGKMIGGFGLVAYPADYGNSGVMTFIVNHAGTVYQKDLGYHSAAIAKRMGPFDPDQTWKKVEPE